MAGDRIPERVRRWWILVAMGTALGVVLLDEVLVGVALPSIRDELGLSQLGAQWVVNSYVLMLTVFVAAVGRLGDLFGHRVVFIAGATTVALGSLGAGLAENGALLIASRAVQGIGAASFLALSMAMVGIAFPERERGTAIGIYGVIAAVFAAIGPFLGGFLTDLASWRWIFLLNVPLAAAVAAVVAFSWRSARSVGPRARLDLKGFAVLMLFLIPLVVALMQGPEWGWGSAAVLVLLVTSALALTGFVIVEFRAAEPLIDFGLLRAPSVIGSNLVIFSAQFSKLAVLVFVPLYLQDRFDTSALVAGMAMLAATIPHMFTAVWSGRLTDRYGARAPTLAGLVTMLVALAWLMTLAGEGSYLLLLPGLVLWGVALPFLINPAYTRVLNAVAAGRRGEAAGATSTGRQLGGGLAVAVLGGVLVSTGSFAAVFGVAAAVTVAVSVAAFLLIDRTARGGRAVAAPSHAG